MNNYEDNINELEKIVNKLGKNESTLDESLELYKKGLDLTKQCYKYLQKTEKEVKMLIEEDGQINEKTFE